MMSTGCTGIERGKCNYLDLADEHRGEARLLKGCNAAIFNDGMHHAHDADTGLVVAEAARGTGSGALAFVSARTRFGHNHHDDDDHHHRRQYLSNVTKACAISVLSALVWRTCSGPTSASHGID